MGTTRLQLYNGALQICGERALASLTENRKPRYDLDLVWDGNGVRACLERGQWQFAMRAQSIDSDPDIETTFGYQNAFDKPTDWVNTSAVCSDERFTSPLISYTDAGSYWTADIDPIYVKFVSDDDAFGGNLALWPQSFVDYVMAYFASKIILALTSDKERQRAILAPRVGILAHNLKIAKGQAQMTQATRFPAEGSWTLARRGNRTNRDGGNTGSLIG